MSTKIDPRKMSEAGRKAYLQDLLATLDAHRQHWIGLDQEEIEEMTQHIALCFRIEDGTESTLNFN